MLPSRSRLQSWNPGTLSDGASRVAADAGSGGANGGGIEGAADSAAAQCAGLAGNGVWSGPGHDAAIAAFGRMKTVGDGIADYGCGVQGAMNVAYHAISSSRAAALDKATEIEQDPIKPGLYVTDQWVVLIRPGPITREQYQACLAEQSNKQAEMNDKVLAVKNADDPNAILSAAGRFGFAIPSVNPILQMAVPEALRGGEPLNDNVPDPSNVAGIMQQQAIQKNDAASRVVDQSLSTDPNGNQVKTFHMQNGDTQVQTTYSNQTIPGTVPTNAGGDYPIGDLNAEAPDAWKGATTMSGTTATTYDSSGKLVSTVSTLKLNNGNSLVTSGTPDGDEGTTTVWLDKDGGRHMDKATLAADGGLKVEDLTSKYKPALNDFVESPMSMEMDAGLTGVHALAERGGSLPWISSESIATGTTYLGPAVGISTMALQVMTAPDEYEACVAANEGSGTIIGGVTGGTLGAFAGGPWGEAFGGVGLAGLLGGAAKLIGEASCPK